MKIKEIIIFLLCALVAWNSYTIFEKDNSKDTALLVLDERIVNAEDSIKSIINYIENDRWQIKNELKEELTSLSLALSSHEHQPIYIEVEKEVVVSEEEIPILEKEAEVKEVIDNAPLESIVPIVDDIIIEETTPVTPVTPVTVVACPKVHNRLGRYIENVRITRDYQFIISYDVKDNQVANVDFSRNLPSNLKRALTKYLNSFQMYGNASGCTLSIKILEN